MRPVRRYALLLTVVGLLFALPSRARGQESPFFVTYDHHLEEPGNLEVALSQTFAPGRTGRPGYVAPYIAPYLELEYGLRAWWTTELYLEGQSTRHDSTVFTGWRWENRWRPLAGEHRVNPVLYLEFEDINEASRIQKEFIGHLGDGGQRNASLRGQRDRELEGKLIFSSQHGDWEFAENLVLEKNLSAAEGLELGYSLGVARPLGGVAGATACRLCREALAVGVELSGGLGSTRRFGLQETPQYLSPVLTWRVGEDASLRLGLAFGVRRGSAPLLLRMGYSYEWRGFGAAARRWWHAR